MSKTTLRHAILHACWRVTYRSPLRIFLSCKLRCVSSNDSFKIGMSVVLYARNSMIHLRMLSRVGPSLQAAECSTPLTSTLGVRGLPL